MSRFHRVAPRPVSGFGFEAIIARPHRPLFRRWYDAKSRLPSVTATRDNA